MLSSRIDNGGQPELWKMMAYLVPLVDRKNRSHKIPAYAMYQIMMDNTKVFAANLLLPPENYRNLLSWVHITCLVQEGECWAWNNDWNNYYKTDTTRQEARDHQES